jgi:hypothetical protein
LDEFFFRVWFNLFLNLISRVDKLDLFYKRKFLESESQMELLKNEIAYMQTVVSTDEYKFRELKK